MKFLFQPDKTLVSLGHAKLFDQNIPHDYSKMTQTNGLFISDAIHKATIKVDEEGTIAAAATTNSIIGEGIELQIILNWLHLIFISKIVCLGFDPKVFSWRQILIT